MLHTPSLLRAHFLSTELGRCSPGCPQVLKEPGDTRTAREGPGHLYRLKREAAGSIEPFQIYANLRKLCKVDFMSVFILFKISLQCYKGMFF